MPAAPAAPPAASPAPASAPVPAPAPKDVQRPTEQPEKDWLDEVGKDLEGLDEDAQPPRPATPPKGKQAEPKEDLHKEDETKPDDELDQLADKDKPQDDPNKPKVDTEKEPTTAPELRKAFKEQKTKLKEAESNVQRLTSRVKELESAGPTKPDEATTKKVADLEKANADLEQRIQFLDYQQSTEFKTKYFEPHVKAWDAALADLAELQVEDAQGKTRPAKAEDLMMLTKLPLGQARAQANAMFGDSADDVMFHVREVRRLSQAQDAALEEARKTGVERAKNFKETSAKNLAERIQQFESANKDLATRYPRFFAEKEGDEAGNTMLKRGFALADLRYRPDKVDVSLLPASFQTELKTSGRLSPQSIVKLDALIRNKVANHDRLALRLGEVMKQLKEAKKALAEFEASGPPEGGSRRRSTRQPTVAGYLDEANAELDGLDKDNV